MKQYKDLAVFAGAAVAVAVFEDKIKTFLEIDTDFSKMGMGGPAQFWSVYFLTNKNLILFHVLLFVQIIKPKTKKSIKKKETYIFLCFKYFFSIFHLKLY